MSGVFGFIGKGSAFAEVKTGLESLSHRGKESWGIVSGHRDTFSEVRRTGSIFQSPPPNRFYFGSPVAVGHVRYPTAGEASERNAQPILGAFGREKIAIVHNGHIPKYKQMIEEVGGLYQTDTDTEVILQMIARQEGASIVEKTEKVLAALSGKAAFSLIILHRGMLIAAKDPFGFRPLSIARRGEDEDYEWAVASETCAFHGSFDFVTDVAPGEMTVLNGETVQTTRFAEANPRPCVLELLDFASPASMIFSRNTYEFREAAGATLARMEGETADIIIPIPRAAVPAALGFQAVLGISFKEAISTVGEIGRIFIVSKEKDRIDRVQKKFQINRDVVKDREVFLVDSILVRGSTATVLIPKLRQAGAKKIHLRLTAPPPRFPCYMGMAMTRPGELLAANRTDEQIARLLGVDSFQHLDIDNLRELTGPHLCDACLSGKYAFPV
jgi:amidophosphoribosyltransferase